MALSRRHFLASGAAAMCAPAVFRGALAQTPAGNFAHLPTLDAAPGDAFRLTAMRGDTFFAMGTPVASLGFNRPYLGPVVRVRPGASVEAVVENRTGREITVHWHGLLVDGEVDGGPHNVIADGESWRPVLSVDQPPATLWYHNHLHGGTAAAIHDGLAGVLLVDDGRDRERGLPSRGGIDDLVLVLQDKRHVGPRPMSYEPTLADALHGFLGDTIVVNGAVGARARVPAGIVRLRLVNASNGRNYDLAFSDARPMYLVATDQGFLPRPAALARLRLTPGERAEVLVDFASGDGDLVSTPHMETAGAGGMDHAMMAPLADPFAAPFTVVSFAVGSELPIAVLTVPDRIGDDLADPGNPVVTRRFTLDDMGMLAGETIAANPMSDSANLHAGHAMGGQGTGAMGGGPPMAIPTFGINGRSFEMGRVDHVANSGTTERWIVTSQMMGHPFHVHGARMRVISENASPPRIENSGWKDTVFVEGESEMLVELRHRAPHDRPFMFHCHILEHEDRGMMGQFAVV